MAIKEKTLTKGQLRKLTALRKSLGKKIADKAFAEWSKEQPSAKRGAGRDPVARKLEAALKSLEKDKSINLGRYGYSVIRATGRGAKGFVVERIEKSAAPVPKKKSAAAKSKKKAAAPRAKKKATAKAASA